jgi:serine protease inhibitor
MNKVYVKRIVAVIAITGVFFSMTGCSNKIRSNNLMKNVKANTVEKRDIDDKFIKQTANFSVNLFQKSAKNNENSLISPISVMMALSMTANGADSTTKEEMEQVLAAGSSVDDWNEYLYSYRNQLSSDEDSKLSMANSIWFRDDKDRLKVEPDFLKKNATYYRAEAYEAPFDQTTVDDINQWVKEHTDGMIDNMVDRINKESIMYLLNAVVFDAKWEKPYTKNDVNSSEFTTWDGTIRSVDMMSSDESMYLDDGDATGFIKNYKGGQYSFVALLPNEGTNVNEYLESLTGEHLLSIIENAQSSTVATRIPKFSYNYTINMNDALIELGLQTAFDSDTADFSKLGSSSNGNIYIGEVLHKSYISVDELGTKAGAVTKVEMMETTSIGSGYEVFLNRPFVYAIIDNNTKLPIFLGTVMDIN